MINSIQSDEAVWNNNSVGNVVSSEVTDHGISITTNHTKIDITVFNASTIRVQATRNSKHEDLQYPLNTTAQNTDYRIEDDGEAIVLTTCKIKAKFSKSPFRVAYYTLDDQIINEDEPAFGINWIGEQVTCYKKLQEGERFLGLGEKTGPLDRRGKGYQNWNSDYFGYPVNGDPLYCSIPFYIGVHNNLSYGIYFNNSYKSFFNFGASNDRFSSFSADAGDMDYFFIYNQDVPSILDEYSNLTGKIELPPIWSIGFQQCRYSYYPDERVLSVADTFRKKEIPADVIVLDIHHMEKYKIFTWDGEKFKDAPSMIARLNEMGFHVVVICDPGIKIEKGYEPFDEGIENDFFIKYPDNTPYTGEVWPGKCHFPDFTRQEVRQWWGEKMAFYAKDGVEGYWNDMNEIATWGQMLPELIEFDFDGNKGTARKGRNLYGLLMAKSSYEGAKKLLNGKRPFNLTRSGFAGVQRYGALWTGDNVATNEHMLLGIRLVNSLGMSGVPFAGYDVGGFVGNGSSKLFARWISVGAFTPFYRVHSNIDSRDSEPWSFGETIEEISQSYITLRYRLLPYLYSLFYEASQNGLPIARSLAINFTHEATIYEEAFENQYLFGPSILVAPVESDKNYTEVYLPKGYWYDFYNDNVYSGGKTHVVSCPIEKLPVFVKGASIIPVQKKVLHTGADAGEFLEIHLYNGEDNNSFVYYEDDGNSYAYQSDAAYYKRTIHYDVDQSSLTFNKKEGLKASKFSKIKLYFHGFEEVFPKLQGTPAIVEEEDYRWIQPLSNFDPFTPEPADTLRVEQLPYTIIDNNEGSFEITF